MGTHASSAVVHTANQLILWCAFEKGEQPAAHDLVVVDDQEPAARRPFGTVATSPRRWRIAPGGTPPGTPDGTRASRARRTTRPSGCLGRSTKDCVRNGRCCCAAERRRADRSTAVSLTDPHVVGKRYWSHAACFGDDVPTLTRTGVLLGAMPPLCARSCSRNPNLQQVSPRPKRIAACREVRIVVDSFGVRHFSR